MHNPHRTRTGPFTSYPGKSIPSKSSVSCPESGSLYVLNSFLISNVILVLLKGCYVIIAVKKHFVNTICRISCFLFEKMVKFRKSLACLPDAFWLIGILPSAGRDGQNSKQRAAHRQPFVVVFLSDYRYFFTESVKALSSAETVTTIFTFSPTKALKASRILPRPSMSWLPIFKIPSR